VIAKSLSIKGQGCIFGRCAAKAAVLTSGGLGRVLDSGLRGLQGPLTAAQESAEAIVGSDTKGPNGMERQVGGISHGGQAAEKPVEVGLSRRR